MNFKSPNSGLGSIFCLWTYLEIRINNHFSVYRLNLFWVAISNHPPINQSKKLIKTYILYLKCSQRYLGTHCYLYLSCNRRHQLKFEAIVDGGITGLSRCLLLSLSDVSMKDHWTGDLVCGRLIKITFNSVIKFRWLKPFTLLDYCNLSRINILGDIPFHYKQRFFCP